MSLESLRTLALDLAWFDYAGYLGMLLGLVSVAMRTIIPLRLFAIGACLCLGTFALLRGAWPTFVVNAVTIPVLAWRTREMVLLTRRAGRAATSDLSIAWLLPFMHPRTLEAGETLFKKGDEASEMFYVAKGRLKLVEHHVELGEGSLVGEIAMFSPARRRTRTVVAATDAKLMSIGESELMQLYYQNPHFGFYLIQLITHRLVANMERLEASVAERATEVVPGSPNSGRSDQGAQLRDHLFEGFVRCFARKSSVAGAPIERADLVGEHNARYLALGWQRHFKGIAFCLPRDRAEQREADQRIVRPRRKGQCRAAAALLVSRPRIEGKPDEIAAVGRVGRPFHHDSRPTRGPQSRSPCRFSGLICLSSASRRNRRRRKTSAWPSATNSTALPSLRPACCA